jgi:hypothetical protein
VSIQVGEAHEGVLDPAAVVAGQRADERPDHRRDARDEERHLLRGLDPVHDAAEVVAAEKVGPEDVPVPERRPFAGRCEVEAVEPIRRDVARQRAGDEDDREDHEACDRQPVPEKPAPCVVPLAADVRCETAVVDLRIDAGPPDSLLRLRASRSERLISQRTPARWSERRPPSDRPCAADS